MQPAQTKLSSQRSPTTGLLFGLIITLAAVLAYASYITVQLSGLRRLQSDMVDRNRKDSLQLLRIQNDLNSIALAMRDMLDAAEPYPLTAWAAQFDRIHEDLDAGLQLEEKFAGANRTPEQRLYLNQSLAQFWDAVNRMFALATPATKTRPANRFASPCSPASRRSAPPSPACWSKITKAKNKPPRGSPTSTTACSASFTFFSPPRS